MFEKICSHCGTTLLVGLHYCPGCLRAIDRHESDSVELAVLGIEPEAADDATFGADSFFLDLDRTWANLIFPIKAAYHRLRGWPEPSAPADVPKSYRVNDTRSPFGKPDSRPTLTLSAGYIRVICPKCLSALHAPLGFSPMEEVTCGVCSHEFPASFAAEFRTGADLECHRCGVTTFCVTGDQVTTCPNCRFSTEKVTAKTKIKLSVLASVAATVFLGLFTRAVMTQTTTHFIVGTCVAVIGSIIGFVTLVALGF